MEILRWNSMKCVGNARKIYSQHRETPLHMVEHEICQRNSVMCLDFEAEKNISTQKL